MSSEIATFRDKISSGNNGTLFDELDPDQRLAVLSIREALGLYDEREKGRGLFLGGGGYYGYTGRQADDAAVAIFLHNQTNKISEPLAGTYVVDFLNTTINRLFGREGIEKHIPMIEAHARVLHEKAINAMSVLARIDAERIANIFQQDGAKPRFYRFGPNIIEYLDLSLKLVRSRRGHLDYVETLPFTHNPDQEERVIFSIHPVHVLALKAANKVHDAIGRKWFEHPAEDRFYEELYATPSCLSLQTTLAQKGLDMKILQIDTDVTRTFKSSGVVDCKFNPEGSMLLAIYPSGTRTPHRRAYLYKMWEKGHEIESISSLIPDWNIADQLSVKFPILRRLYDPAHPPPPSISRNGRQLLLE